MTGHTAAGLILARADPADPHFGLRSWSGGRVRKHEIVVAKNYSTEGEIDTLNRLVVIFLETADLRAKRRQEIPMRFWMENVGQIIASNGFALLEGAGTVSREQMEAGTNARWLGFDEQRKKEEARAADAAELAALEDRIKRRKQP